MKKIIDLLTRISALKKEASDLDRLETKTRADVLDIAKSNVSGDVQKQKIRDARMTLDLLDAKRDKVVQPLQEAQSQLGELVLTAVGVWNSFVTKIREGIEASVISNTASYFNGDEGDCRRWWAAGMMIQLPIFYRFQYAAYDTYFLSQNVHKNPVQQAEAFIRHLEQQCDGPIKRESFEELLEVYLSKANEGERESVKSKGAK